MRFILYKSVVYILHKSCVQNVYKISVWVHQDFQGNLKSLKSKRVTKLMSKKKVFITQLFTIEMALVLA